MGFYYILRIYKILQKTEAGESCWSPGLKMSFPLREECDRYWFQIFYNLPLVFNKGQCWQL